MESVKDIIQQCHERRGKDLQQRETIVSPTLHGEYPYHYIVYCARRHPLLLHDLEQADISFMPIGQAPFDEGASVSWWHTSPKTTRYTQLGAETMVLVVGDSGLYRNAICTRRGELARH